VGTLEGLTRDIIAKEKIQPQEGTFQESLLEQDYDEKAKLFPPKGGKRRSSKKYRKNNKKNKTKSRKG
jgi:hypothetical protein